jgi:hypothetical protein
MASSSKAFLGLAALGLATAAYAASPSRKKKGGDKDAPEPAAVRRRKTARRETSQPAPQQQQQQQSQPSQPSQSQPSQSFQSQLKLPSPPSRGAKAAKAANSAKAANAASDIVVTSTKMKKSESFTDLAGRMIRSASRASLSPTQRLRLEGNTDELVNTGATAATATATAAAAAIATTHTTIGTTRRSRPARTSKRNSTGRVALGIFFVYVASVCVLATCHEIESDLAGFFTLIKDVLSFNRIPSSAQDIPGAIVATCVCTLVVFLMDVLIARPIFPGDAAQWFCLHALANAFVVVGAVPDFYFVSLMPSKALSAAHCYEMGKWACSDWPTCMIVAIHIYHMLAFKLTADDLFHHLTFVPVIGGGHFVWPWGAAGNILCFFISGFPGGIDYALLALVKAGSVSSLTEKRINLSINVWIRAPGITAFCILAVSSWLQSSDWLGDGAASDIMPVWGFVPALLLVFYNGQYYSQRVIGNYYIRVTQDEYSDIVKVGAKRPRVELHAC